MNKEFYSPDSRLTPSVISKTIGGSIPIVSFATVIVGVAVIAIIAQIVA